MCSVNSLSRSESLLDGDTDMNGGSSPGQHSPPSGLNNRLRPQLGSPVSSTSTAEVMLQRRGTGVCSRLTRAFRGRLNIFFLILVTLSCGLDLQRYVARSYTSSRDGPFSLMSSLTLSNNLLLGFPLFLLPYTSISIALLPMWCSCLPSPLYFHFHCPPSYVVLLSSFSLILPFPSPSFLRSAPVFLLPYTSISIALLPT